MLKRFIHTKLAAFAMVSLGFALCAAQLYPTFKWATGYGHACQRLEVDGTIIATKLAAA